VFIGAVSVAPEEGRPVLWGKEPAAGEPGVGTKRGERAGMPSTAQIGALREAIGMQSGAPARVKRSKYQQIVANDLRGVALAGSAGTPQSKRGRPKFA